ncbi:hypothetical protein [uncultured Limnobacter sp.]|uniref:hypothetical protein n=1 Tax=Limnobacter sp. TaxID=2003368 RepID=UPI0030FB69A3
MNGNTRFEIDFSEAKPIVGTKAPRELQAQAKFDLSPFYEFSAPEGIERASGPCAIGMVLHHHQIGWNHIPKDRHGHPQNDLYILEIMRWAACPDLLSGTMGTSPAQLLKALRKAELNANWYAGNTVQTTLELIQNELFEGRPVIALLNNATEDEPLLLEWEVIFSVDEDTVMSKQAGAQPQNKRRTIAQFEKELTLKLTQLSCSVITARKD